MDFHFFNIEVQKNFKQMFKGGRDTLFTLDVPSSEVWEKYLDSFPEGTNNVYRERREFDCSCCRHFLRDMGTLVSLNDDGSYHTMWDLESYHNDTFKTVSQEMSNYLQQFDIKNVFIAPNKKMGTKSSVELLDGGEVHTWHHFYTEVPQTLLNNTYKTVNSVLGEKRTNKQTLQRALSEITLDSVETVLEIIAQGSLYRGNEFVSLINQFKELKVKFDTFSTSQPTSLRQKENFVWLESQKNVAASRIRNSSIGTLLVNISEGMDLNQAVSAYETIVAPESYKRPKAIYTQKMIEQAHGTVKQLGYEDSLGRKFATLEDIDINNILFANRDAKKQLSANPFEALSEDLAVDPKKFKHVQEVSAQRFFEDILPTAEQVSILFENRLKSNLMSLIAPANKEAKSMLKWDNNFSWAYEGNLADSSMRGNVQKAGGSITGDLRFSIQWNDGETTEKDDLDAHCKTPNDHIYFGRHRSSIDGGELDVDIIYPKLGEPAVENITWDDSSRLATGDYRFFVHNYHKNSPSNNSVKGFKAEIEIMGEIYEFVYNKELRDGEEVNVATVHYNATEKTFKITTHIDTTTSSTEVWGLKTNQFVPVNAIMNSPNYWNEQKGIGNQHVFFMMDGCINKGQPNGFYNEYLDQRLNEHRRVFEALGSKMKVDTSEQQLSGLGFSTTQQNELYVKVVGKTERLLKIKF